MSDHARIIEFAQLDDEAKIQEYQRVKGEVRRYRNSLKKLDEWIAAYSNGCGPYASQIQEKIRKVLNGESL